MAVAGEFEQARKAGMRGDDVTPSALEELALFGRYRLVILEVVLEQVAREARVEPVDVGHYICCSNRATRAGCS